jgi:hypothetical protein
MVNFFSLPDGNLSFPMNELDDLAAYFYALYSSREWILGELETVLTTKADVFRWKNRDNPGVVMMREWEELQKYEQVPVLL